MAKRSANVIGIFVAIGFATLLCCPSLDARATDTGTSSGSPPNPSISDRDKAADAELVKKHINEVSAFQSSIMEADHKGDYAQAVRSAKEGIALGSYSTGFKMCGYCEYYYAKALVSGRGTEKNEQEGFKLLKEMYDQKYQTAGALDLAQLYADGIGTKQDLVKAYEIARENDNLICTNGCDEIYKHRAALEERLEHELTNEQINEANRRAKAKNPNLW